MKNIKTFYEDNKQKIKVASCVAGAAVIGAIAYTLGAKNNEVENPYQGKDVISWIPTEGKINLEQVKEVLDLNANNSESFMIFKEGPNPDEYDCVLISDNVIIPESEKA